METLNDVVYSAIDREINMSGSYTFTDVRQSALDRERNMSGSFTFTDVRQSALDREIIAIRLTLATSVGLQSTLLRNISHSC